MPGQSRGQSPGLVILPHLGLGDALVLRGLVAHECARLAAAGDGGRSKVYLVCKRAYLASLQTLFADLPNLALVPVGEARDVSPAYGASRAAYQRLVTLAGSPERVRAMGYHSGRRDWMNCPAPKGAQSPGGVLPWWQALYAHYGLDPALMELFRVPEPLPPQIPRPREPYVVVHDDAHRKLVLPPAAQTARVLHVDDPAIRRDDIFAYVDLLRGATAVHAIDSCFAWLVRLDPSNHEAKMTVHAYAKHPPITPETSPFGAAAVLASAPGW